LLEDLPGIGLGLGQGNRAGKRENYARSDIAKKGHGTCPREWYWTAINSIPNSMGYCYLFLLS
jgi:hypothetical protein